MIPFLKSIFTDRAVFLDLAGRVSEWLRKKLPQFFAFGIAFLGYLMDQGAIPTGVDGGGKKYGMLLVIAPYLINFHRAKK